MEILFVNQVVVILSRRGEVFLRFIQCYKQQCSIMFWQIKYARCSTLHFYFCGLTTYEGKYLLTCIASVQLQSRNKFSANRRCFYIKIS